MPAIPHHTTAVTEGTGVPAHLENHLNAQQKSRPPRDELVRAFRPGVELRASSNGADLGTLTGHFAVFNEWTEIDSIFEGHFLERIAPGAFAKTFQEQRDEMRVLFQHGMDFQVGDKPLGPIELLEEDDVGAHYEVPLLDTSYNRDDLIPGLRAGLYGASFRFRVMREDFEEEPDPSDSNPRGLPQRTIREAQVFEFGPVTFPAYPGATAGMRSLTDRFIYGRLTRDPERFGQLAASNGLSLRVDCDAVAVLGQMMTLGASYADEEDDPQDAATMQTVLASIADLLQKETAEPDASDETDGAGATQDESASNTPRTTPGPSPTSNAGAIPLFPKREGKETPSWRL